MAAASSVREHEVVGDDRRRAVEVADPAQQRGGGALAEGVDLGLQGAQLAQQLPGALVAAEDRAVDRDHAAAAQRLGKAGEPGEADEAGGGRGLVGRVRGPVAPAGEHGLGLRGVPGEHARVDHLERQQRDLERGHDAERAAAAAQGPEELGVALGVGADDLAVRGHELGGEQVVALQPVAAGQPAHAAAQRVAGDADVGGGAVQRGEAMRAGGLDDVLPEGARADAGDALLRIDGHAPEGGGPEEDGVFE